MKKVLLIDQDSMFTSDLVTTMFLDEYDLELTPLNDLNDLSSRVESDKPDEVVMHARLLKDYPNWKDLGVSVGVYAKTEEDVEIAESSGAPYYGLISMPEDLLNAVVEGKTSTLQKAPAEVEKPKEENKQNEQPVKEHHKKEKKNKPVHTAVDDILFDEVEEVKPAPAKRETPRQEEVVEPVEEPEAHAHENNSASNQLKDRLAKAREEKARKEAEEAAARMTAEEQVDRDLSIAKPPARMIAVYSAKGGVGKTKISSELATYLALTEHGRGTFNVCVIDYNIDSGNIMNTLGFDAQGICMTQWANDIQERLNKGQTPEEIQYTDKQISMYLQKHPDISLSALLSPMSPGDSLEITDEQMAIMYDNIVNNGNFDFIIVDTGNNIRDSTYMALERAEKILLVVTQDFNCMNDNYGVMTMAESLGDFDMDRVKLVLNMARRGKVGITIDEVLGSMINPASRDEEPFECIAIIEDNDVVRRATNLHEPLVLSDSNNKFTKSIGEIVHYLTDDDFVLSAPKKKGFFARLFGK